MGIATSTRDRSSRRSFQGHRQRDFVDNPFCDWRYRRTLSKPDFGTNCRQQGRRSACRRQLVGSSRRARALALTGLGPRAVIAIDFRRYLATTRKNGLLPVVVDAKTHAVLQAAVSADPATRVSIDLESSELTLPDGSRVSFPVDPFARHCLLNGIDELGYILSFEERIEQYEARAAS